MTLLMLGSDADSHRTAVGTGGLTDAIAVVSVRADGSGLTLVSLPRDTADVPMPDGTLWQGKINAMARTVGLAVTAEAIGHLLGVEIDHYVQVDMDDLGGIVDAIGGVSVDVSHRLSDAACTIEPGINRFDGRLALCYARHRQTDNDYARAGQQQLLLLAILDGLLGSDIDVRALVGSLGSLQTDLDLAQLDYLAHIARLSQGVAPQLLVLGPPDYTVFVGMAGERGWISTPNVAAIQSSVAALLEAD